MMTRGILWAFGLFCASEGMMAAEPVPWLNTVPVGEHPRLFFTNADVPAIRQRAYTPQGRQIVADMQILRENQDRLWNSLDIAGLDKMRAESMARWSPVAADAKTLAFLYIVTGSAQDGKAAVRLFRLWLEANPPDSQIKPAASWGAADYAMAYDWIYDLLTPAERERTRRIFAAMLGEPTLKSFAREWYLDGPKPALRPVGGANEMALCVAGLALTDLAIEGQPGYNQEILTRCIQLARSFLDESVAPDGALYEGMGYAMGFGTHHLPPLLLALRLRHADISQGSHLGEVPAWMAYEILPWGYESFDLNQSDGTFAASSFGTFIAKEYRGLGVWMLNNLSRPTAGILPDAILALANGLPGEDGTDRSRLPLSHWFSTRGLVFCRNGWGPRDAVFAFNTNPVGAGRTHADQGSFCLAANGAYFLADSGAGLDSSKDHNVVHIDGLGQPQREGAVDAYIRTVETNNYADVIDADLKLSYDRVLQGEAAGSWWWREYNPVEKADRRALFIRGMCGAIVIVADDIRKDPKRRDYDWRVRTVPDNILKIEGRRFMIGERFGGRYLYALAPGCQTTLAAQNVPAGTYHGWLLVRSEPGTAGGGANNLTINDKKVMVEQVDPDRDLSRCGWHWQAMRADNQAEINLPAGQLKVGLESVSGGRVALAVFARNLKWQPGDEIPTPGGEFIVLGVNAAIDGEKPWGKGQAPKGVLDGVFLATKPPILTQEKARDSGARVLHAVTSSAGARFLAVMVPHDDGDGTTLETTTAGKGQMAMIRSAQGTDLVTGSDNGEMSSGELQTDGVAAAVSLPKEATAGNLRGYVLSAGRLLRLRDQSLVESSLAPVHVVNDGRTLVVRAPGGARVKCLRLGAVKLVLNGIDGTINEPGTRVTITVPVLPKTWSIKNIADGRKIQVTGDGPLPLRIPASGKAVEVFVNGVSRYFVRDREGRAVPALQTGADTMPYRYLQTAAALKEFLDPETPAELVEAAAFSPDWSGEPLLKASGNTVKFKLPVPTPGMYRLTLVHASPSLTAVKVTIDGKIQDTRANTGTINQPLKTRFDPVPLRGDIVDLGFKCTTGFGVVAVELAPDLRPLPIKDWMVVGPFPSRFVKDRDITPEMIMETLKTPYPPEQAFTLAAIYKGSGGREIRWLSANAQDGLKSFAAGVPPVQRAFAAEAAVAGVNFIQPLGVKAGEVCYAVTYITSPEDRQAELQLGCDSWAVATLNGESVRSERPAALREADGAQFCGDTLMPAAIKLKKGVNVLLVKCLGGDGSNSFMAYISDPGDLKSARTPAVKE